MASVSGHSSARLEFRTSTVKKTTQFYKDYIAGKLSDENFKWPECPIKFITQNPLIGAIESPDRSSVELVGNDDDPESPGSSHLQQMPIFNDMAKRIKNDPEERVAPKMEPPAVTVMVLPHQFNQVLSNISNNMAQGIAPMLGMPVQTQHPWTGGMTPAYNNPAATPMHSSHDTADPGQKSTRAKLIPLESHFDVDHRDPRPQPPSRTVPRKPITLQRTSVTARFIETYKRTNRNLATPKRVAHSSRIDDDFHNESMQKKIHAKNVLKNPAHADDFHPNQLENVSDSDEEADSDISPPYESVQTSGATSSTISHPEAILPNISSENDSDASRNTVEFTSSSSKDGKEMSSRSSKKRHRSHSTHTKHDKRRSSDKHERERSSSKRPRNDKERNSDHHHERSQRSDKRERSRSCEKPDYKKKRVAPLLINKRNNTVISKGEAAQDERSTAQNANKENQQPATSTYVPRTNIDDVESNLKDLFSPPRRTTGEPFMGLGDSFNSFPSPSQASSNMDPMGPTENDVQSALETNENQTEQNYALDEMDTLVVSQSPTGMVDDVLHALKIEGEEHFDDSSESVAGEPPLLNPTMENRTVPANTYPESNQVNSSSKSQCVLCAYHNDSAKKLVAHYVNMHPDNEVYVSRITEPYFESVVQNTFMGVIADVGIKSSCPFCDVAMTMSAEKWVTHFTEHTGEFENRCTQCKKSCTTKIHVKCNGAATISIAEHSMDNGLLRAYMCRYCYFTQLNKSHVENHISNEHQVLPCLSCVEFILLRKLNALPANANDSSTQEVSQIARQLAQQNEIPGSIVEISDDSQDTKAAPNGEPAGEGTEEGAHIPPSNERPKSLETKDNENMTQSVTEFAQDDAAMENLTTEPNKEDENPADEMAVKAEDDETNEKQIIPFGFNAAPARTTRSPDSKTSSALLAAKEQMESIGQEELRPIEERLQNATIDCTIELLSSDDEDEEEDTVAKEKPIMMSCYSVDTSDEE